MLRAGVAIRNITPQDRLRMCGYPDPADRSALLAHDPLYGSVFYFENEKEKLIFMTLDLVGVTKERCNEIRMLVEKHLGIPRKNVAVACTHTHSGPITGGAGWGNFDQLEETNPKYNDYLRDLLLDAAYEAVENAFDAKIGWGVGICGQEMGVGGNRHDPDGPCDPSVSVLGIKNMNDELRGCMVNYSLHPTVLHADSFVYTADYPCYIRQTLNGKYPFMIFGFQMGSSGDQSSRFFRQGQDFREAERIGGTIGKVALEVLENLSYVTDAELKCASVMAEPPLKDFPSHEKAAKILAETRKVFEDLVAANAPYKKVRAAESIMEGSVFMEGFTRHFTENTIDILKQQELPIECQAMRIGDYCIMGVACENFIKISQAIKAASPFEVTVMSSVTNGTTAGYVCTDEAYDKLCYEAQCTTFAKGAEAAVTNAAIAALELVK